MRVNATSERLIKFSYKKTITLGQLYDFSLTLFLCFPAVNFLFYMILRPFGIDGLSRVMTLVLVYIPVVYNAFRRQRIVIDFWLLWVLVILFFMLTYMVHPNYETWYTRSEYGVWEYVLSPENGLYIYLLLRLVNDPKRILKCIKISSLPMYFYYSLLIQRAIARGYWIDTSNRGYEIHLSYNLSLGYSILLFTLTFLYCALEEKKLVDWMGAAIGGLMILIAGSRGPFLDIIIFLIIYAVIKISNNNQRMRTIIVLSVLGLALYFTYPILLIRSSMILDDLNLSSRFIKKLVNGSIADDAGRMTIWKAAINMIKEKPMGYGAMGSRHVLNQYVYVAHPHEFFLEILIDFGVIVGTAIIIWLFIWTIRLFTLKESDAWKGVFLIFFSRACQLLVSMTFWHSIGLWGAMAIGVCMWGDYKKKRRLYNVR